MQRWILSFLLLTVTAFGGDLAGTWKAKYTSPDGVERDTTFQFQVDGMKFTGTMESTPGGKQRIEDGVIEGDTIRFRTVNEHEGSSYRIRLRGKLEGDDLKLRLEWNEGEGGFDFTAHRVKG
jgi:hypothetical protein